MLESFSWKRTPVVDAVNGLGLYPVLAQEPREAPVHRFSARGWKGRPLRVIEEIALEQDAISGKPHEEVLARVRVVTGVDDLQGAGPVGDDAPIRNDLQRRFPGRTLPRVGGERVRAVEGVSSCALVAGSDHDRRSLRSETADASHVVAVMVAHDDVADGLSRETALQEVEKALGNG